MMFAPRPKGLGSDNFLKLNDREKVVGVFKGDLYKFRRHWVGGKGMECEGADKCPVCKEGSSKENYPSFRFRINFVTDKMIPKIFEGGAETYDALTLVDAQYDLSQYIVQISRRGLGKKTTYEFEVDAKTPLTKENKTKIESVTLLSLS